MMCPSFIFAFTLLNKKIHWSLYADSDCESKKGKDVEFDARPISPSSSPRDSDYKSLTSIFCHDWNKSTAKFQIYEETEESSALRFKKILEKNTCESSDDWEDLFRSKEPCSLANEIKNVESDEDYAKIKIEKELEANEVNPDTSGTNIGSETYTPQENEYHLYDTGAQNLDKAKQDIGRMNTRSTTNKIQRIKCDFIETGLSNPIKVNSNTSGALKKCNKTILNMKQHDLEDTDISESNKSKGATSEITTRSKTFEQQKIKRGIYKRAASKRSDKFKNGRITSDNKKIKIN